MKNFLIAALLCSVAAHAQTAEAAATSGLLSEPGPTFHIADTALSTPLTFIVYGDQRFTDPANWSATDPRVRKWLVDQIAREHPAAVFLNGDVPLAGNVKNDYAVFRAESAPWLAAHIHVYPALGNHEFHGDPRECLENWWSAFPELRNRRWYSVQLGSRVYALQLDSDASLLPGSDQARWLDKQLADLPATVDFVILSMHHPPVADVQQHFELSHNPRPNEIALRDYLTAAAPHTRAHFLVSAGHIHNYERNIEGGVTYLVSGGGGAKPVFVERTAGDQYKSLTFPNYHYVKFTLEGDRLAGTMFRVANSEAAELTVEPKDTFTIQASPR